MTEALILITTAVGSTEEVYEKIKNLEGIEKTGMLTGPYDIMALLKGGKISEIMKALMTKIRNIEGIVDTTTCIVIGREEP